MRCVFPFGLKCLVAMPVTGHSLLFYVYRLQLYATLLISTGRNRFFMVIAGIEGNRADYIILT